MLADRERSPGGTHGGSERNTNTQTAPTAYRGATKASVCATEATMVVEQHASSDGHDRFYGMLDIHMRAGLRVTQEVVDKLAVICGIEAPRVPVVLRIPKRPPRPAWSGQ